MGTKTLNISIPLDMADFLDANPDLSASKVFQGAITNIENSLKSNPALMKANKEIEKLNKFIITLQEHLTKATDFIESKNLGEEFFK